MTGNNTFNVYTSPVNQTMFVSGAVIYEISDFGNEKVVAENNENGFLSPDVIKIQEWYDGECVIIEVSSTIYNIISFTRNNL